MDELLLHNAEEKLKAGKLPTRQNDAAALIQDHVMNALLDFCRQDKQIAEAIIQADKPFSDCLKEIVKDTKTKQYISDFEAYARAVRFYVPDCEIECKMTVKKAKKDVMNLSLFDLME